MLNLDARSHSKLDSWLPAGMLLFYVASTSMLAIRKLMWNDELLTFYTALRPTFSDIWVALLTGSQQIPPLFFFVTRFSLDLFGPNPIAVRLPEILGFGLMCVTLFAIVIRRSSVSYGLLAALFPLVTPAFYYAYEARPYGLVLGFACLSLFFWLSAAEPKRRTFSIAGVGICLALAISLHYYAVLILIPLSIGELTRSIQNKRVDVRVWIALVISLAPLMFLLPLIRHSISYSRSFWAEPEWISTITSYTYLLRAVLAVTLAGLVAAMLLLRRVPAREDEAVPVKNSLRRDEFFALGGFLIIPVVTVLLAKMITGAYTDRYVLPSLIGFAVLIPLGIDRLFKGRAIAGWVLVIFFFTGFSVRFVRDFYRIEADRAGQSATLQWFQSQNRDPVQIAVSSPHLFLQLSHYATSDMRENLMYLADRQKALRHLQTEIVDAGVLEMKECAPVNVYDYQSYLRLRKPFLIHRGNPEWSWLLSALMEDGRKIDLISRKGEEILYRLQPESN